MTKAKRTQSHKVFRDKAFKIVSDPKYDGYQRELASTVYKFFDKKSSGSGIVNIWGVDLADMQSLSKYNKVIKYLLCAVDIFSKCAWDVPLKDKRGTSIVNVFQMIISERRKPNKIWVDQGSEFYNNYFKNYLKINNIEIYSTHNEGKSVVAERFIMTPKSKIFKRMTAISKNIYFDVLDNIVNKYNNTVHRTIKVKPIDVTSDSYAEYNEDSNKNDTKFKVGDHVRIPKYKNIFAKAYVPNYLEEVFVVSGIKNAVPWTYVVSDLNGEEITGSFYEKELQKTSQKKFRIEKVLKRKGDKLYVKWKGYDNSFNIGLIKKTLYKNESILS